MWFRNLQLFRVPVDWKMSVERLDKQLAGRAFRPCGAMEMQSSGWVAPRSGDRLVHALERQWLIALEVEQKLLPASVIRQVTAERLAQVEAAQGRPPGRRQAREMRERVTEELLPRAFTRRRRSHVWIDPAHGWLAIDAASAGRADEVVEALNRSLDEFPVARLDTQLSPGTAMAGWLASGEPPPGFTVDRDCELRAPGEDGAAVRYVKHPLDGEEVRRHIAGGKVPTKLALTWNDRVSFVLTDKLEVKRLGFLDLIRSEAREQAQDEDEQFDADFALMAGELRGLLEALTAALGGQNASTAPTARPLLRATA